MKQLKNFLSDLISSIKSLSIKKIVFIILVSTLIITPSILAVSYFLKNEYIHTANLFKVTLYNSNDEMMAEDSRDPESATRSSLTGLFYLMINDPIPLDVNTTAPNDAPYVKATIEYKGNISKLKCYFSPDTAAGYYTDENGKSFLISEKLNSEFLSSPHSEIFYSSATVATLSTIDKDTITPKTINWLYKNSSGSFVPSNLNISTDKINTYEITGAIDMSFDITPDQTRVYVYNEGDQIYVGDISGLDSLTVNANDKLHIYIDASWDQKNGGDNYGTVSYEFYAQIKNQSTFSISADEVHAGGFLILDCSNITNASKISFTSNREGYIPNFKQYNGLYRVVIPFPYDIETETFDFTISYGASSQSFSIKILPPLSKSEFTSNTLLFDDENLQRSKNDSIRSLISKFLFTQNNTVYFHGNFLDPNTQGFSLLYSHGSTVKWGESLEFSCTAIGNEYIATSTTHNGSSVLAVQNGIVSYTGSHELLGNYVVVDHGCGVRTWYTELGKVDVEIGDVLLRGQHIGKTTKGNLNDHESFILYCTVYDTIIDPDLLWNK